MSKKLTNGERLWAEQREMSRAWAKGENTAALSAEERDLREAAAKAAEDPPMAPGRVERDIMDAVEASEAEELEELGVRTVGAW